MKQYKVAIIGNGMICNAAHIPAYQAMGDKVRIVAVADIREEAARETAERHGIPKYYVDPYKMLEEEKPDIISVCTPNAYHKEYTLAGFRAGCHVVCEKPGGSGRQASVRNPVSALYRQFQSGRQPGAERMPGRNLLRGFEPG